MSEMTTDTLALISACLSGIEEVIKTDEEPEEKPLPPGFKVTKKWQEDILQSLSAESNIEAQLGQLKVKVKYLVFDLECIRRENRYLRRMLKELGHQEADD